MFERFTERARHVVVLAQEEARELGHGYIGTEHVLLGLLREQEGLAARVLESLDITVEGVRSQVVRIVASGEEVSSGQIPFTPRAKKVLELALREALALGHNFIGTEHILLGLVRENEGVAARVLRDFDADSDTIRNAVIRALSGSRPREAGPFEQVARSRVQSPAQEDVGVMLAMIERHIRGLLHREPDNGDLLVILATLPEGVVGRALAELGITDDALDAALTKARASGPDSIDDQIELAMRNKDQAIDQGDLAGAVSYREEERRLAEARDVDLIGQVRSRLGLLSPASASSSGRVPPESGADPPAGEPPPEPPAGEQPNGG
jgi:ATP-dependent Clp protease ATP-binding subunit ClpA